MKEYGIVTEAYSQFPYKNKVAVKRATFYQSHMLEIRRGWHYSTGTSFWSNFNSHKSVCLHLWLLEAEVDCGHRVAFFLFVRVLRLYLLLQLTQNPNNPNKCRDLSWFSKWRIIMCVFARNVNFKIKLVTIIKSVISSD